MWVRLCWGVHRRGGEVGCVSPFPGWNETEVGYKYWDGKEGLAW